MVGPIYNKPKKRLELMKRQRGYCWLCGQQMAMDDATFDHIIPKSLGGGNKRANLKLAHRWCNKTRGSGYFVRGRVVND